MMKFSTLKNCGNTLIERFMYLQLQILKYTFYKILKINPYKNIFGKEICLYHRCLCNLLLQLIVCSVCNEIRPNKSENVDANILC